MNRDNAARVPETLPSQAEEPRLVLFGLPCRFTDGVVRSLDRHGVFPVALLTPGPPGLREPLRSQSPPGVLPMIGQSSHSGSPFRGDRYQIGSPAADETVDLLRSLAPDVIAVACYPQRLPHRLHSVASLAALNVHPSLLPRHRGPDPLFWTLRDGEGIAGVSVHELSDELDAGPIRAQESLSYEDGTTEAELETALADIGGRLLAKTIRELRKGERRIVAQTSERASYESWPERNDYIIDTRRSARSAFNFITGVADRDVPAGVRVGRHVLRIERAIAWAQEAPVDSRHAVIEFDDGVLLIELARVSADTAASP